MRVDSSLIHLAARLLSTAPALTNAQLLGHLTKRVGPRVARDIPINRFEAHVRRPALHLLRTGAPISGEGPGEPPAPKKSQDKPSPESPKKKLGGGSRTNGGREAAHRENETGVPDPEEIGRKIEELRSVVDQALIEAFSTGASCESRASIPQGFSDLTALRNEVAEALSRLVPSDSR